jgi:hypothetical protein
MEINYESGRWMEWAQDSVLLWVSALTVLNLQVLLSES